MSVTETDDEYEDFGENDDFGAEDDGALIACPHCERKIHEESQKCEHCGQYVTEEFVHRRRPWWFVVGAALCFYAIYLWIRH